MNKNIPTRFKNLLKDCSPTVKEYMEAVFEGLIEDTCYKDIKTNGAIEIDSQGRRCKNKNFTAMWEASRNIMALTKAFCFTPAMKTRMKAISKGQTEKSPLDDFLNSDD